ncbi:MAG: sugar ABC transporter permease [Sphaerochaetaceae bacterium]|nr:sugar ABC transporter permease [Sphaerochaetaceae bacterium]MDD3163215.1 sugar ABC transporter permease [Sphaerochaetaceae bacterium]MDD4007626.1 sugar ABC transporter permease [Sphaerochaetaceae bacterium]
MRNKNWKQICLFLLPALLLYAVFFIYPLFYVFITSFTQWNGIGSMKFIGFKNFTDLFANETFRISLKNNFIWSFALGFIQIPLATIMALVLARKPKGWKVYRTVFFLPNVISQVALAMMWTAIYNADGGILNSLLAAVGLESLTRNWLGDMGTALGAVIVQQLFYIGYFMVVILASRMGIPESYYEAAEIDGANVWQQEIHISLPNILPILITSVTLAMAYGMRHFESTFLMTNGGPAHATSVLGIMLYQNLGALKYGVGNAIGATLIVLGGVLIMTIRWLLNKKSQKMMG